MEDGTIAARSDVGYFVSGYRAAFQRLGPELRKQIPKDWHAFLGRWLALKEE